MRSRVLDFRIAEAGFGSGICEVVQGVCVNFGQAGTEVAADEEFEALEFGLEDY